MTKLFVRRDVQPMTIRNKPMGRSWAYALNSGKKIARCLNLTGRETIDLVKNKVTNAKLKLQCRLISKYGWTPFYDGDDPQIKQECETFARFVQLLKTEENFKFQRTLSFATSIANAVIALGLIVTYKKELFTSWAGLGVMLNAWSSAHMLSTALEHGKEINAASSAVQAFAQRYLDNVLYPVFKTTNPRAVSRLEQELAKYRSQL